MYGENYIVFSKIFQKKEKFRKIKFLEIGGTAKYQKKIKYHATFILIKYCIPLNLGSNLACIALNMLEW